MKSPADSNEDIMDYVEDGGQSAVSVRRSRHRKVGPRDAHVKGTGRQRTLIYPGDGLKTR